MSNHSPRPGDRFQQNRNRGGGNSGIGGSGSGSGMQRQSSYGDLGGNAGGSASANSMRRQSSYGDFHRDRDRDRDYHRGSGGGGGNRSGRSFRRNSSHGHLRLNEMPLEQGRVHTLLDNFGFIYCANRPGDIFFHYSEFRGYSDDLNIGDEVQFHVGPRSGRGSGGGDGGEEQQLSAYSVTVLEPGTVQWEVEDEPVGVRRRGKVERMIRFGGGGGGGNGGGGMPEGTIRLLALEEEQKDSEDNVKVVPSTDATEPESKSEPEQTPTPTRSKKKGGLVRFTPDDYPGYSNINSNNHHHHPKSRSKSSSSSSRGDHLERNDLVEFTLVTEKRSGLKYARGITLVQSERARLEEERERKMLERATAEQGIIVSMKNGFGFIRSNCRREEVYFHFSQVMEVEVPVADAQKEKQEVMPPSTPTPVAERAQAQASNHNNDPRVDDINDNNNNASGNAGTSASVPVKMLEIGQEVGFLVVQENDRKKISARKVQFLPKGSVVFEQIVGVGVKGILTMNPKFALSGDRDRDRDRRGRNNKGLAHMDDGPGAIKLCKPLSFTPVRVAGNRQAQDIPSIDVANVSLFPADCRGYMKDEPKPEMWFKIGDTLMFDVMYDVVDGTCRAVPTKRGNNTSSSADDDGNTSERNARIKLLAPSLAGRAEGIIASIKDNYGFVQLAHRNVDVYFRLSEVFPVAMQQDFLDNGGVNNNDVASIGLVVGTEVTFDISLLPPKNKLGRNSARHGRRGGVEKEQMRAQRLAIIPNGTVKKFKVEEGVTGTVMQMNRYNLFAGQIRLNKKIKEMSQEERHPMITKLIRRFLSDHSEDVIFFQDVQSEIENEIILDAVRGKSSLEVRFTPVSEYGEDHRGRICICKVKKGRSDSVASHRRERSDSVASHRRGRSDSVAINTSEEEKDPMQIDAITCNDGVDKMEEDAPDARDLDQSFDTTANAVDGTTTPAKKTSSKKKMRSIKMITFERGSLSPEYIANPPKNGDEVSLSVTFCRSTGTFVASNLSLTKRNVIEKQESSKAVKYNLCEGYVLLEPVHTSFKESKSSRRRGFEGGGWNTEEKNTDPNANSHDDGIILLLADPAGLYKRKSRPAEVPKQEPVVSEGGESPDVPIPNESDETNASDVPPSESNTSEQMAGLTIEDQSPITQQIFYTIASTVSRNSHDAPKRGDLVTFSKGKGGKAKEVKTEKRSVATKIKGNLCDLNMERGTATFQSIEGGKFDVNLSDVVSCDLEVLKENVAVEGIQHDGKVVGICRSADLYLESTIVSGSAAKKERPKLNLTVKKELRGLGGKIIAQSGMAKGPDGTNGFASGWTSRVSKFVKESVLNVTAEEFTPASFMVTPEAMAEDEKEISESVASTKAIGQPENALGSEAEKECEMPDEPQGGQSQSSTIPAS